MKYKIFGFIFAQLVTTFILILIPFSVSAQEKPLDAVVINQIRGRDACCQPGNMDMLEKISAEENFKKLPIAWAIRYDVFQDADFLNKLKQLPDTYSLGLSLEVTPKLASDSGVSYKGNPDGTDWYYAHNVFLIGYTQPQRQKLLDRLFKTFYDQFNYYPTFTVSWMVDAWSLDYLRKTYGVVVHEITKEQYETDSYTLYGGIFNLPYYPSKSHPLVPAKNKSDQLEMLIMRQTISDIDKNYGSYQSFFTSQPNDYLANPKGKGPAYFLELVNQMQAQNQVDRFAVLGLENSREWDLYQEEYIKQLKYIVDEQQAGKIKVWSPHDFYNEFNTASPINPVRILKTADFPRSGALWYFSNYYRARLENWQGQIVLTDLRVFTDTPDPYSETPADKSRGYWIIPYLIDSSQQFEELGKPEIEYQDNPIRNDTGVKKFGIILSNLQLETLKFEDEVLQLANDNQNLRLEPNAIFVSDLLQPKLADPINITWDEIIKNNYEQYFLFSRHPRFFISPEKNGRAFALGWENVQMEKVIMATISKEENLWKIQPRTQAVKSEIQSLASIYQPDRSKLGFDSASSVFFWSNKEAIAGRSPVRLFISAQNALHRPTVLNNLSISLSDPSLVQIVQPENIKTKLDPFLIDFIASKSAEVEVKITVDGNIIPAGQARIRFYTDCSHDLFTCLRNRDDLKGFFKIIIKEKFNTYQTQAKIWFMAYADKVKSYLISVSQKIPDILKSNLIKIFTRIQLG